MDKKRILIAFSWGHQFPKPGFSNEVMAKEILKIKKDFDYILVQIEISDALISLGEQADFSIGKSGEYINTYEVAKEIESWMLDKKINPNDSDIYILCHRAHWSGLRLVLQKLKISSRRIEINVPYDLNSSQWYTRGPIRTFLGKALHFFGYLFRGELF